MGSGGGVGIPFFVLIALPASLFQGEIRATAFNEQVDKFFPLIELNKVLCPWPDQRGWGCILNVLKQNVHSLPSFLPGGINLVWVCLICGPDNWNLLRLGGRVLQLLLPKG